MKLLLVALSFSFCSAFVHGQEIKDTLVRNVGYVYNNGSDTIKIVGFQSIQISDSIQIDGIGRKELVFMKDKSYSQESHGGTFDYSGTTERISCEIWNLDTKKIIFTKVLSFNSHFSGTALYGLPQSTSFHTDFKIEEDGTIILSNTVSPDKSYLFCSLHNGTYLFKDGAYEKYVSVVEEFNLHLTQIIRAEIDTSFDSSQNLEYEVLFLRSSPFIRLNGRITFLINSNDKIIHLEDSVLDAPILNSESEGDLSSSTVTKRSANIKLGSISRSRFQGRFALFEGKKNDQNFKALIDDNIEINKSDQDYTLLSYDNGEYIIMMYYELDRDKEPFYQARAIPIDGGVFHTFYLKRKITDTK